MAIPAHKIKLEIIQISALRPHEETVASMADGVLRALLRDGFQRDPIAVDAGTRTVLDGSHRVEALTRASAKSALAWVLDYEDPEVRLFRWHRLVTSPSEESAEGIVKELRLDRVGTANSEARGSELRIIWRGQAFGRSHAGLEEELQTMRDFDRAVTARRLPLEFVDEEAATSVSPHRNDLFLIPPRISKADVLRAGSVGRLLPPKSTLHVFPFRPLGVNYPLKELRAGKDIIESLLGSKRPRFIESPSTFGGRGYREAIVVFE